MDRCRTRASWDSVTRILLNCHEYLEMITRVVVLLSSPPAACDRCSNSECCTVDHTLPGGRAPSGAERCARRPRLYPRWFRSSDSRERVPLNLMTGARHRRSNRRWSRFLKRSSPVRQRAICRSVRGVLPNTGGNKRRRRLVRQRPCHLLTRTCRRCVNEPVPTQRVSKNESPGH